MNRLPSRVTLTQGAVQPHFVIVFRLELGVFALKKFQNVLRDFVAHVHFEPIPVMTRTIPEVHDKTGHGGFAGGVAKCFVFFADGGGDDLFHAKSFNRWLVQIEFLRAYP